MFFFDSRYRSRNDDGGYIGGIVVKGFIGDARNIICFTFEKDASGIMISILPSRSAIFV